MKKKTKVIIGVLVGMALLGGLFELLGIESSPGEQEVVKVKTETVKIENTIIEKELIDAVVEEIEKLDIVKDAAIKVKDNKITLSTIVISGVEKDTAKELGTEFAKLLSSTVAMDSNLIGATEGSLGELYDQYDLSILIGTGADNIIAQGVKLAIGKTIKW